MKYSIVTFGCRVNQADSLAIEAELAARGGEAVASERAEIVVVNTCSVTASADQGARQTIRRIARTNPGAKIVATGCYATRCADEVATLPGVVAVITNDDKLRSTLGTLGTLGTLEEGPCGRPLAPGLMGRTAWTLRVQTGCEEQCSYCIIPTTRGASRSRTLGDIQVEVDRVLAAGYKEIVITGVHLGSYGRDLSPQSSLRELLVRLASAGEALGPAEAGPRVLFRVSSLEPMDFPRDILDLVATPGVTPDESAGVTLDASEGPGLSRANRSAVAPHFHLPLQHASNRILDLMQRPYSIEYYANLVDTIRGRLPHAAIGSDVIAGFPGETDDDFGELVSYLETSPLTHLHVFPYSDRPGTVAASMPDKVHGSVIKARAQRLREISRRLADDFRAAQRSSVRPALTIDDGTVAVTDNYFRVAVPEGHPRNEWISVTL
jgi:threonylcarbamoyladenosine tRNA methylthiotransferase MtaB